MRSRVIELSLLGALLSGCASSNMPSMEQTDGGPSAADAFDAPTRADTGAPALDASTYRSECEGYAAAYCRLLTRCSPATLGMLFADEAECRAREAIRCWGLEGAPGVKIAEGDWRTCAGAIDAMSCEEASPLPVDVINYDRWPLRRWVRMPSACPARGDVADGRACADDVQCASGYCNFTFGDPVLALDRVYKSNTGPLSLDPDACGVCASPGQEGGSCEIDSDCSAGLRCRATESEPGRWACVRPRADGESCGAYWQPCARGSDCILGVCRRGGAVGDFCSQDWSCAAFPDPLVCDHDLDRCVLAPTAEPGGLCRPRLNVTHLCQDASTCIYGLHVPGGELSVCVPAAEDGAYCNPGANHTVRCSYPALCALNICTIPNPHICGAR